jgi:hypothetical protein
MHLFWQKMARAAVWAIFNKLIWSTFSAP